MLELQRLPLADPLPDSLGRLYRQRPGLTYVDCRNDVCVSRVPAGEAAKIPSIPSSGMDMPAAGAPLRGIWGGDELKQTTAFFQYVLGERFAAVKPLPF
jgi:hypothetical protein